MRRITFAAAVLSAALCIGLFTASVAGAQAPAATISVTGTETTWSPNAVTVTTGETVRWSFTGSTLPHNVHGTSANWSPALQSPVATGQEPVDYTFAAPGVYTFVCDVHPTMTGTVTVEDPAADPLENVLVFSKTAGFRHSSIDEGIAAIQALGAANDFEVDATEDSAQFTTANLAQYDAVVFLSTTGDVLNDEQQDAFESYMRAGGGFVGIHAAADTEYTWPWYGQMIGAYFRNHPSGTYPNGGRDGTVDIEDANEPSTEGLPVRWARIDEWYNYQSFESPSVGGGGDDYSARDSDVHVLATVDESTYDEADGSDGVNDDHPISWCSDFDGGHVWYTGMGHTEESFGTEPGNLRSHILGGLQTVTGAEASDCGEPRQAAPTSDDFELVTIDDDTESPMELAVANDGRVFYVERITGELNVYNPANGQVTTAITIPVSSVQENGAIGIALDPNFDTNNHLYVAYTPPTPNNVTRVSRFTVGANNTIAASSEQFIFQWIAQREQCCHSAGSLAFAPNGDLYISTGDNTNPFASDGFTPIDERPGREFWDAQRTSANSNNHNGKLLRIHPLPGATGTPGIGTTYSIPSGNMFAPGTANTLPEIYAMGFRNPFRITVDPHTGWVLLGNYGPDAGATDPNRGPQGSVEFDVIKEPGFYGWPYCVRDNVPYNDYNFANGTSGPKFNCNAPVNDSPNNTGIVNLPAAKPATMWLGYTETDPRFPGLGTGGAPTGGPRYEFDPELDNPAKFPEFYDGHWFIGEWNNGWIRTATLNAQGNGVAVNQTPWEDTFFRPHEMEFGPDGSLYVIDWGSGFNGNNANSGIYRIDYVAGARRPIARATSDKDSGPTPLTVQFSSDGSIDPDGSSLTYAWDFDGNGTTDSTEANPTHTYSTAGTFNATLTVTDADGQTGFDTIPITAGNTRPTVTITVPEDGQFAAFGDLIPYEITVTDPEDGTIACNRVTLNVQLGHDDHAHPLSTQQGCSGTFRGLPDSGHGGNANIFTSIVASYTDNAQGAANALTGQDDVVIQPKPKQAEFFDTMGRIAGGAAGGTPGVQTETTSDAGGGLNIGFIEHGDYVSFERMSLKDLTGIRFRVASGGAGGTIQLRLDSPTGTLAGEVAVANTGGWQTWTNVDMPLSSPPGGTHELFLVFVNAGAGDGGLFNINHFTARGKGAAVSAAPDVTASAEPMTGDAPLQVQFTGTATDPDAGAGEQLTYLWDFGVAGSTTDTSTELSPTYTYERPGTYLARFTATDPHGASATASVQVQVTSSSECPQNNVKSDEFEGDSLDTNRWQIIRPDSTRPPTVSGGNLNFPIDVGSIYGPGTSARNIIVQPLPDGDVEVTAKITTDPLTQNYQQAGLRVYQDDNNWASVHMIYAGTGRDFEFIYENNGNPRNEGQDKLGGIPADAPLTYWVKLISDGSTLRAEYSYNGTDFSPVGRVADISGWAAPQVGPVALSDAATTYPVAHFDWIRFNPDSSGGGGGGGGGSETELFADQFDGTDVGSGWDVVRRNQALTVSGGALRVPAATGDLYQTNNTAANLVLRDPPATGSWNATAKINFEGLAQYQQAGIIVRGDDDNYVKLGRIAHTTAGDEKFEYIHEAAANPDNTAADSTQNIAGDFPDDYWVQLRYDGTNVTGWYSTNGSDWTQVGRAWPLPANAQVGVFSFGNTATSTPPEAAFDSFRITRPAAPAGPSFDDEFDGSSLDAERWNASVRQNQNAAVSGGMLTITTEPGDIYSGDTTPPPNNFILQDASHAGDDWTIETKIDSRVNGGYGQGGLMAYVDGNNYVKLDPIADAGQTRINRIELRTEINGTPTGPATDPEIAAGTGTIFYLRLNKNGTSYTGEYSRDGTTWLPAGTVTNPMADPDFGVFAFGPQADGQGDDVSFDYFWLDGQDAPDECECVATGGDSFDSGSLDKQKWNHIVREQEDLYSLNDGWLEIQTVNGDIYTNGDPAPTRNFILQDPTEPNQDWVIETHIDAATLSQGYEQAGLLAYGNDDNYVKYDILSDDTNTWLNRIELRSEVAGQIVNPQPQVTFPQAGAPTEVWLRLTKSGTNYSGEYSLDGTTWQSIGQPVANTAPLMAEPAFGIFTLGVNSGGGTARFEYFSLDGSTGCEEPEPQNRAPVIDAAAASPTTGFAPLEVQFTSAASDPDAGDELAYSWDFDNDGTADATTANATHTYTTPGEKQAKLTVSDGEATTSRTLTVNVLEADDPDARFRVLVFSKTAGFRHSSIDDGHAAIEKLGDDNGFQVDHTEDATAFRDAILGHYDAVVWLSTTGDVLNDTQQAAFERFIKAGHGYAGIHAAADTEYEWKWYGRLVGAYFLSHPVGTYPNGGRDGTVIVEDTTDHSTQGLPAPRWDRIDEWYNYKPVNFEQTGNVDYSPRANVHVLASLDESTYEEADGSDGVDDDHPISWCKRYDGGRSWYTGMGHTDDSFTEANFLKHILGGIEVAAGTEGSDICNIAPTVDATADPRTGQAPLAVAFSANGSDAEGAALTYSWDFGDGGTSLRQNPDHTYLEPGTYTAKVTVKDPKGATGTATVEIVVTNPPGNVAPTVEAAGDPTAGKPPLAVQFSATGTDPDGDPLTYSWDFGDGGRSLLQNPSHTYANAGTYTATVTVSDGRGGTATDTVVVTVGNRAPAVELTAMPVSGTAPLTVQFSAAGSDPDGDALTYQFDFGEGKPTKPGPASTASHKYGKAGTYTAKVTVTDTGGATATDTVQITVTKR